jgi:hypothetical protein
MQEIKYTFYLNTDDIESAHHYLQRIQEQLLHQELVVGLREDITPILADAVQKLFDSGEAVELENGFFPT